jgi:thiamine pyrophosphokinase
MTCYIFGAGEYPREYPQPSEGDLTIAADGGVRECARIGRRADLVIGDFDSLGEVPTGDEVIRLPVEKDVTDMAAAVDAGRARGAKRFVLLGGTGGRPDHTYANYQLLASLAARGEEGYLIGREYSAAAISDGSALIFPTGARGTLSVFSFTDTAEGVTERGMYYTVTDATLRATVPLGVSNHLLGEGGEVHVRRGTLLVMWEGQYLPQKLSETT